MKLDKIYSDVAKKHGVSPETVEKCFRHQFYFVRNSIKEGRPVLLHELGTFGPTLKMVNRLIRHYLTARRKGQDEKKVKDGITYLWQLRRQLMHTPSK